MLIDSFVKDWFVMLEARGRALPEDVRQYLLLDAAFVPGLNLALAAAQPAVEMQLLFDRLPGANDKTRSVSPILVSVQPQLEPVLQACSGWPMVSVLETPDTIDELSQRMAAWCLIETEDQTFNFRFPDTRRLPAIWRALTQEQRGSLMGAATRWRFIGRDGVWEELHLDCTAAPIAEYPVLNRAQFSSLVDDSAADAVMAQLAYRGFESGLARSQQHRLISQALGVSRVDEMPFPNQVSWCEVCLQRPALLSSASVDAEFNSWRDAA